MKRIAIALCIALGACKGHEFHPPDRSVQVQQADSLYRLAMFDTIKWNSEAARQLTGNEVYASKCDKCHGSDGMAGTAYARERNLNVPALATLTITEDSARHRVFIGHVRGMPIWGVSELTVREIDAVAHYVAGELRR